MIKNGQNPGGPSGREPETFSQWFHSWRYLFWLVALVGLSILFYAEEDWRGERAWRLYKENLVARGEHVEAADFIPPRVPDEENFAMTPALGPLFGFVPGTQRWANPNAQRAFEAFATYDAASKLANPKSVEPNNSWVGRPTDLPLWAAAFAAGTNYNDRKPLAATNSNDRAAALVLQAMMEYAPVLEELQKASHLPQCRFNIRYEEDNPAGILLPHLAQVKRYCLLLQLRASAELELSRTEEAMNDIGLMLYLADSSRQEPILISQLVRMSEFQLALQPLAEGMGKWSEPQLRALQERLHQFDFCADTRRSLEAERAFFGTGMIEWVRRSPNKIKLMDEFQEMMNSGSGQELWPVGPLIAAAPDGWLYLEERNQSRACDQYLLPLIDLTNQVIRPAVAAEAETALKRSSEGSPVSRFMHHRLFATLLLPATPNVARKTAFAQTAVETAVLACALERYRLAHGQFPASLQQLTPDFTTALPHDIVNGQPLHYRLDPAGHYALYSVGWNEKDDGGRVQRTKNREIEQKEGDWVWTDTPRL